MSQLGKILVSLVLFCAIAAQSAVNYPYPQRKNYGNGTINATSTLAPSELKAKFVKFMEDFYVEGNCSNKASGTCARIRWSPDHNTETVSEGIGYAMIMMVYFSDNDKDYRDEFNKLWTYYQNWTNDNGIMNWRINGFSNVIGYNGATDAEFDVALALAMAQYQFVVKTTAQGTTYENAAKDLIGKIWTHEMESNGMHKPGDGWNDDKNPSYVSPAAFEIFKGLGNATNWDNAIRVNYDFLKNNQNKSPATGLPSGWAQPDGTPKVCSNNCGNTAANYDQDAVRAPWRWAWANAWFGNMTTHASAKTLINKLATWVVTKNPSTVAGPIALSGTMGANGNSAYVGSLACVLTDSTSNYQTQLNSYWNVTNGVGNEPYFNQAMRLLTGLLITGNMPNLKACPNCGTNMGGGGGGSTTQIDRFRTAGSEDEDDRGFSATWEPWYAYIDSASSGSSTISNPTFSTKAENDNCKDIMSYRVVLQEGNEWAARIPSYNLVKGNNQYGPYVALGLEARNNGTSYDFKQCTGFKYSYKGSAHNFKVQTTKVDPTSGADYFTPISTASTTWKEVEIPFTELAQPVWAGTNKVDWNPSEIYAFAWELKGDEKGTGPDPSALTGSFAVKEFLCMGNLTLSNSRPPLKCSTPSNVKPSLIAGKSSMQLIKNGVSLQVANNASLEVFSLNGKQFRKMNFANGTHSVQFSDLPKGLYIVKVQFENRREVLYVPVK